MSTSVKPAGSALVCLVVLAAACSAPVTTTEPSLVPGCEPNRKIIKIHGTGSTGQFNPRTPGVALFHPQGPSADLAIFADTERFRQEEFDELLEGFPKDCLLTFSYDDLYLSADIRGVNAWNWVTSPWDHDPDVLADHLQRLIDSYPGTTFDIVAYSAGGIVPTYWAARPTTTDAQRQRVRWIIAVDAIVSGADALALDIACLLPAEWAFRRWHIGSFGRIPCQFSYRGPFTKIVRGSAWTSPASSGLRLATLRADGDLIVQWSYAGLPDRASSDPPLVAEQCALSQLFDGPGPLGCVFLTHESVLRDGNARTALLNAIGVQR